MTEQIEYGWRYVGPDPAMEGVVRVGYTPWDFHPGEWEQVSRTVTDWTTTADQHAEVVRGTE